MTIQQQQDELKTHAFTIKGMTALLLMLDAVVCIGAYTWYYYSL